MFHYIYKITNKLNNKIYIGVHSTDDLNDNYMGSSIPLSNDILKFGENNFKKEILEFFNSRKAALLREKELVNWDFVKRQDTYNLNIGGSCGTPGLVPVKDKFGNTFAVHIDDPKYISGELVHVIKGIKYNITEEQHILRSQHSSNVNKDTVNLTDGINNRKLKYWEVDLFLKENPTWRRGQTQHWSEKSKKDASTGGKHKLNKILKLKKLEEKKLQKINKPKIKKCRITNDIDNKMIPEKNLNSFLKENPTWRRGQIINITDNGRKQIQNACLRKKSLNYKFVTDGINNKMIPEKNLNSFLKENPTWKLGVNAHYKYNSASKGYKWMYFDSNYKYVAPNDIQKYKEMGWKFGYKNFKKHI